MATQQPLTPPIDIIGGQCASPTEPIEPTPLEKRLKVLGNNFVDDDNGVYEHELRAGLVETATSWKSCMSMYRVDRTLELAAFQKLQEALDLAYAARRATLPERTDDAPNRPKAMGACWKAPLNTPVPGNFLQRDRRYGHAHCPSMETKRKRMSYVINRAAELPRYTDDNDFSILLEIATDLHKELEDARSIKKTG